GLPLDSLRTCPHTMPAGWAGPACSDAMRARAAVRDSIELCDAPWQAVRRTALPVSRAGRAWGYRRNNTKTRAGAIHRHASACYWPPFSGRAEHDHVVAAFDHVPRRGQRAAFLLEQSAAVGHDPRVHQVARDTDMHDAAAESGRLDAARPGAEAGRCVGLGLDRGALRVHEGDPDRPDALGTLEYDAQPAIHGLDRDGGEFRRGRW